MSEYMWGITYEKPSRASAKKMDKICKEEGGYGYNEVNVKEGRSPGINNGRYQGWFCGPNMGDPFDGDLARRVDARVEVK
jgi:hypothetical protein